MPNGSLDDLARHDDSLIDLPSNHGGIVLSPALAGRIFAHIDGQLVHRLDARLLEHPLPDEFNNLGGNSLWPAPEGGPLAFNYRPGTSDWYVQPDVSDTPCTVAAHGPEQARIEKDMTLVNRRGIELKVHFSREVMALDVSQWTTGDITGVGYRSDDRLDVTTNLTTDEAILTPWSLEQFVLSDDVTAFAQVRRPEQSVNLDFYGQPDPPPTRDHNLAVFRLGGNDRWQVGFAVANLVGSLGAIDRTRGLAMIRLTEPLAGTYINIADNEQPEGPFSAADAYSIFNGGELGFFELETIGAMVRREGALDTQPLVSETVLLSGPAEQLVAAVSAHLGIDPEKL